MPPAITVQGIAGGEGWYVLWGPASGRAGAHSRVISFAVGTDGLTFVPLILSDDRTTVIEAGTISADFTLTQANQMAGGQ
jgi:hypothetical protein